MGINACMKFYDERKHLYLKTCASGISPGAGLLKVRGGMSCMTDESPDNVILPPIAFASKSLSSAKACTAT